jgi:hypothetical protein
MKIDHWGRRHGLRPLLNLLNMRKVLFVLFAMIPVWGIGQKYDRNWVMGAATIVDTFPRFEIFNMIHYEQEIYFDTIPMVGRYRLNAGSASYSDREGNLRYYSNGKAIYNVAGEVMENGDSINFGLVWTQRSQAYGAVNCIVPIPDIASPDSFSLLIHARLERGDVHAGLALYLDRIMYSKVDLYANDGLGKVVAKDIILAEGVFETFTMVRHANGRDWWIVTADKHFNILRSFLLTTNGIAKSTEQVIGPVLFDTINNLSNSYGFLTFSHDGLYLARINIRSGFWLYEFDRCTGDFVGIRGMQFPQPLWQPGEGLVADFEYSPSGQYLYFFSGGPCFQIDLWQDTLILMEMELQGEPKEKCNTGRREAQLGPDGKIYIAPGTSSLCMHIIHYPDLPWPECQFIINDVELPVYNHGSLVHYPNFRLGALEGSPCDTLGGTSSVNPASTAGRNAGFRLYPNPASREVTMELDQWLSHEQPFQVTVYSPYGVPVYRGTLPPWAYLHRVPVHHLSPGLYILELRNEQGALLGVEKLIVE